MNHSDEYRALQDLRKQIERVERELKDLKAREEAAFWAWGVSVHRVNSLPNPVSMG